MPPVRLDTSPRLPSLCVCSKPLNVSHALSCPFGGFSTLRYNEVRDITSLAAIYRRHEQEKSRKYEERVREVEYASFVPVVLSTSGGYGNHANALFSRIASLLAEKSKEPYAQIISLLRCRLGFALVRYGAMCLRGSRSMFAPAVPESPAVLVVAEAGI